MYSNLKHLLEQIEYSSDVGFDTNEHWIKLKSIFSGVIATLTIPDLENRIKQMVGEVPPIESLIGNINKRRITMDFNTPEQPNKRKVKFEHLVNTRFIVINGWFHEWSNEDGKPVGICEDEDGKIYTPTARAIQFKV